MNKFRVGDSVVYIEHSTVKSDLVYFKINNIYNVLYTRSDIPDVIKITSEQGFPVEVYDWQIKLFNPCEKILQNILDT